MLRGKITIEFSFDDQHLEELQDAVTDSLDCLRSIGDTEVTTAQIVPVNDEALGKLFEEL